MTATGSEDGMYQYLFLKNIEKPFALEDGTDILTAGSELWMIGGTDAEGKIEGGGLSMGRVGSFKKEKVKVVHTTSFDLKDMFPNRILLIHF